MTFVAASDASDEDKRRANYVCDGIADDVEIQAAIDGSPYMLQREFNDQQWFKEAQSYWKERFRGIEARLSAALGYVQLDRRNRGSFSLEFASILRDAGSVFGSVLDALVEGVGSPPPEQELRHHGLLRFAETKSSRRSQAYRASPASTPQWCRGSA